MCNWEVPKWYPEDPCRNLGHTHIISNDRGHILPGYYKPSRGPWSGFKGTWDLPKKITRKVGGSSEILQKYSCISIKISSFAANELTATPQFKIDAWKNHCAKGKAPIVLQQHRRHPKEKLKPVEIVTEADAESTPSEDLNEPDKVIILFPSHIF